MTGTETLVVPAVKVTVDGTVATPVLSELKFMVTPLAGAGAERINETKRLAVPVIVKDAGKKLSVAVTCTVWLAEIKPVADAVIFADPKSTPVILGVDVGAVAPGGTRKLAGLTVTLLGSLLTRETNSPPAGAGLTNVTGKFIV